MSEGRGREHWAHTSALLALLANVHRDPKKHRAFSPADFNPYEALERRKTKAKTKDLSILKTVFVDSQERRSKT
jgi:hypothetical protein